MRSTGNPNKTLVGQTLFVRYLDHIAQIDIHEQRGRYHNLIYPQSMDEDRQAPPLSRRPGYEEAKTALAELQKQSRREMNIVHIPTKRQKAIE